MNLMKLCKEIASDIQSMLMAAIGLNERFDKAAFERQIELDAEAASSRVSRGNTALQDDESFIFSSDDLRRGRDVLVGYKRTPV